MPITITLDQLVIREISIRPEDQAMVAYYTLADSTRAFQANDVVIFVRTLPTQQPGPDGELIPDLSKYVAITQANYDRLVALYQLVASEINKRI